MDKVLVVFYSYTGTCRQLAQLLSAQLGWPTGEIVDAHSRSGPTGTLRCVADTLLRRRPLIRYDGPDPKAFDAVVLVSPIWVYGLAGPMRSFIAERAADLRQVAAISAMGAQGASNAVAEIARLLGHAPVLTIGVHFARGRRRQLRRFVGSLRPRAAGHEAGRRARPRRALDAPRRVRTDEAAAGVAMAQAGASAAADNGGSPHRRPAARAIA